MFPQTGRNGLKMIFLATSPMHDGSSLLTQSIPRQRDPKLMCFYHQCPNRISEMYQREFESTEWARTRRGEANMLERFAKPWSCR
jgi:hypothetical protein